eukprot:2844714-Lingulodinium_polyedra.AAC.1
MKGRQMIWIILDYFKTNQSLNIQYAFQDLQEVLWMGDDKMDEFLRHYRYILSNLKFEVPDEVKLE